MFGFFALRGEPFRLFLKLPELSLRLLSVSLSNMPSIKLAAYQGGLAKGVQENLALLEQVVADASKNGADLVVFSELFLQGYFAGSDLRQFAETKDGASYQRIAQVASQYQVCGDEHIRNHSYYQFSRSYQLKSRPNH